MRAGMGLFAKISESLRGPRPHRDLVVRPQPGPDNPLWVYFQENQGRLIHKWHHYFDIYHNHFSRFRGREITLLEIGVFHGGSLQMWKHYFGPKARIFGVDVDARCLALSDDQARVIIGDQADRGFLRDLKRDIGPMDIVIDDGGHTMIQQLHSFEELFPAVKEDGLYLVEDLHTSYWDEYGGGFKHPGSFIEYSKSFIDRINAWHSRDPSLVPDEVTRTTTGLHIYDSVLVLEKFPNPTAPRVSKTGRESH
jgi:hypothetical protein